MVKAFFKMERRSMAQLIGFNQYHRINYYPRLQLKDSVLQIYTILQPFVSCCHLQTTEKQF